MLQGNQKVLIQFLRFLTNLFHKCLSLYRRIILLRISRSDFLSVDAEFENIYGGRIGLGNLRQWAKFSRNMSYESRLDQGMFDDFFEGALVTSKSSNSDPLQYPSLASFPTSPPSASRTSLTPHGLGIKPLFRFPPLARQIIASPSALHTQRTQSLFRNLLNKRLGKLHHPRKSVSW